MSLEESLHIPVVTVFGASRTTEKDDLWKISEKMGEYIGKRGWALRNGGYSGTMEASSKGHSLCGKNNTQGVIVSSTFTSRPKGNQYLSNVIDTSCLSERLGVLTDKNDVKLYIVLPGTLGTLTELVLVMCKMYIGEIDKSKVKMFVWRNPFESVIDNLVKTGVCDVFQKEYLTFVDSLEDLIQKLDKLSL